MYTAKFSTDNALWPIFVLVPLKEQNLLRFKQLLFLRSSRSMGPHKTFIGLIFSCIYPNLWICETWVVIYTSGYRSFWENFHSTSPCFWENMNKKGLHLSLRMKVWCSKQQQLPYNFNKAIKWQQSSLKPI